MDIGSKAEYPASLLSNFASHRFVLDGVEIHSMEGFLQSLKFADEATQLEICALPGPAAKKRGSNVDWQRSGDLYWKGQKVDRLAPEYQLLLDRAFEALFTQNSRALRALLATGDAVLDHSKGKQEEWETVLTRDEFIMRLMRLRDRLRT